MQEKQCKSCGVIKSLTEFSRHQKTKDGHRHNCKECDPGIKFVNLTGHRYGRLTVIRQIGRTKLNATLWLCKCDCGKEKIAVAASLRRGKGGTKSCGCLRVESFLRNRWHKAKPDEWLPEGGGAFDGLFNTMKRSAIQRGYKWSLTKEQVYLLTKQSCTYCGTKPAQVHTPNGRYGPYVYNGLDRQDNSQGYTISNIVPCCGTCNKAKRTMTVEQFRNWIIAIYNHFV